MRGTTTKILLAAALSVGGVMANPAHAVASASSPEGVCGSGFHRVADSKRAVKTSGGDLFGYVYLLYNRKTGYNCVTTIKTSYVGTATYTSATLITQTRRIKDEPVQVAKKTDGRKYKYYAGPVKLYGKGVCVKYSGTIWDTRRDAAIATGGRNSWGNCG
ncbi:hypothetical protein Sme01_28980 [Sphaerisporangium melleum]|uniref:Spore-associated protein A n=1 Tax=Sphaerisporangium melleum TaxID=321316 RepID=A0A917R2L8_9ACTN|nr:hypothetical protein [Sphaerisporangium melleum]GGK84604.1 hypothetical protein GCM10007964_28750 [Sphaerisporangium melleum]GII70422.1 hypothetical protein Sme01_28980 [Sphaerisporangium melleum]